MKEIQEYLLLIEAVANKHSDYKTEAYHFILSALNATVSKLEKPRHLTGQELSIGIRDYVLDQFGPLAKTVLEYWGLKETLDFGNIVYRLIDVHLMSKTDQDSLNDFKNVYAFKEAFGKKYDFLKDGEGSNNGFLV